MTAPIRLALDGGPPCLASASAVRAQVLGADHGRGRPLPGVIGAYDGGHPGQGPAQAVRRLERRWGDVIGRPHVVACRSASAAARLAVASLELEPGDEIICPVDATGVAARLSLGGEIVAVYVDLDPQTLHIDPAAVDAAVTDRTRAILAVDTNGVPADYDALDAVARRHGLVIIEDGSQAIGASFQRRPVGSLGTASFCALTESGAAAGMAACAFYATDDADQAANARRVLLVNDDLGLNQPFAGLGSGRSWSYRISELDAGLADTQLTRLDYEVAVRRANGRHLRLRLAELAGIWMPDPTRGSIPVHATFPVLVQPDELGLPETAATALRDTLIDCTTAEGLWVDRSQPQPMAAAPTDEVRLFDLGPPRGLGPRAGTPRRADYPVADAMWASGLLLGPGRAGPAAAQSLQAMDRIADCFTKILVDNADRLRQLTIDRMRATP